MNYTIEDAVELKDAEQNPPILPFAVLLFAAAGVVVVTAVRRRKAK